MYVSKTSSKERLLIKLENLCLSAEQQAKWLAVKVEQIKRELDAEEKKEAARRGEKA